jgi:NAD(P)-dependent dehydrogenase (short-subunit alcohol dehydrogenase family)
MGDVANLADLDRLYKTVADEKRAVDIVVTNAGFVEHAPLATATPEHFDKTFNINARGVFFTEQKALPLLANAASAYPLFIETSGLVRSARSAMGRQFCPAARQRTNPRLHRRQRWEPLRRSERSGEK